MMFPRCSASAVNADSNEPCQGFLHPGKKPTAGVGNMDESKPCENPEHTARMTADGYRRQPVRFPDPPGHGRYHQEIWYRSVNLVELMIEKG